MGIVYQYILIVSLRPCLLTFPAPTPTSATSPAVKRAWAQLSGITWEASYAFLMVTVVSHVEHLIVRSLTYVELLKIDGLEEAVGILDKQLHMRICFYCV